MFCSATRRRTTADQPTSRTNGRTDGRETRTGRKSRGAPKVEKTPDGRTRPPTWTAGHAPLRARARTHAHACTGSTGSSPTCPLACAARVLLNISGVAGVPGRNRADRRLASIEALPYLGNYSMGKEIWKFAKEALNERLAREGIGRPLAEGTRTRRVQLPVAGPPERIAAGRAEGRRADGN